MKPRVHCDLIKAWADGAIIQMKCFEGTWQTTPTPTWSIANEYRIKPEPRKFKFRFFLTKTNSIRCWTESWMSSETEVERDLTFEKWISEKMEKEFDV